MNGLDQDLRVGAGIAADGFRSLEADEAHADSGAKAAEAALDASCDFSEY